jgi:hypothetical protein
MIDIVLVLIFCYQLHRLAHNKGLSPWPYLMNYLAGFFLMAVVIGYTAMALFGKDLLQDEEAMKKALALEPFAVLFEVLLFLYLRNRIAKAKVVYEDDDTDDTPPPPGDKKDLSYFR